MKKLLLLVLLASGGLACSVDRDEVNVRLTLTERERVDKATTIYMDSIRPILDSLCSTNRSLRISLATDSIVQQRLEQEMRLRSRNPQDF